MGCRVGKDEHAVCTCLRAVLTAQALEQAPDHPPAQQRALTWHAHACLHGWLLHAQVGAHGTGARIPPVDDQIVSMRLVTPGLGGITLSKEEEPELFSLAKVGLGALGVVTQVRYQGGEGVVSMHGRTKKSVRVAVSSLCMAWEGCGSWSIPPNHLNDLSTSKQPGPHCPLSALQVTLQCVPRHRLVERTFTTTAAEVKKNHAQ